MQVSKLGVKEKLKDRRKKAWFQEAGGIGLIAQVEGQWCGLRKQLESDRGERRGWEPRGSGGTPV